MSDSYNMVCGKDWGAVVKMAKKRVLEYGLPPRVIKIYTESEESKLITRIKKYNETNGTIVITIYINSSLINNKNS